MKSSDQLKDLLNLETFVSSEEARKLALAGKLERMTTVQGDLNLNYSTITSLPEGLVVGGDLWLRGTKITSLPNDLKVKGTVYGSTEKMKVPEGINYERI